MSYEITIVIDTVETAKVYKSEGLALSTCKMLIGLGIDFSLKVIGNA